MFKQLLALLAVLLVAGVAGGQTQIGNGLSTAGAPGYSVSLRANNDAESYLVGNAFPLSIIGFTLAAGSGFTGNLYACDTVPPGPTPDFSGCDLVVGLTAPVSGLTFQTTRLKFALEVTTPETVSPGSLLVIKGTFGQVSALGGSGGGVTSGPFDEADYNSFETMTSIVGGEEMIRIYVSNAPTGELPLGLDTNPGTRGKPIRSLDAALSLVNSGDRVWILLDSQDVWSSNQICIGIADPLPCCTGLIGGTCALGEAFNSMVPSGKPDEVNIRISSTDPSGVHKAEIQCNDPEELGNANRNVFSIDQTLVTDQGWVVVENIKSNTCDGWDHYQASSPGNKLMSIGAECYAKRGDQDNSGHCVVLKSSASGIHVGGVFVLTDDPANVGSNDPLALEDAGGLSPKVIDFFSDWDMQETDYTGNDGKTLRIHGSSEAFLVGSTVRGSGENLAQGNTNMIAVFANTANGNAKFTGVRSLFGFQSNGGDFNGGTAAFRLRTNLATQTVTLRLFQSTFANVPTALNIAGNDTTSPVSYYGRGVLWDNPPTTSAVTSYFFTVSASNLPFDVDVSKSIYDDGEQADSNVREWNVQGASRITCAAARDSQAWTNFWDSCDLAYNSDDGIGTPGANDNDGDQFQGLQDQGICAQGQVCSGGFPDVYSEPFPFTIPAFVTGKAMSGLTLGGADGNIGAR